uniref:Response regulatory domain-containing protein n=1 Tax=Prymnesium polylepis TaxID=72548 RepID=A0A7S4MRU2_9EUKA
MPHPERVARGALYLFVHFLGLALSSYSDTVCIQLLKHQHQRMLANDLSAEADSQVNHVLKNRLIGATFILTQLSKTLEVGRVTTCKSQADISLVLSSMRTAVDWIHRREVFLQLSSGTYLSVRRSVDVRSELSTVLAGHGQVELVAQTPRTLEVDVDMLAVMLEEGASNAVKYKAEGSTVSAIATLVPEEGHEMLRLALDNAIPAGKPALTPDECVAAFQRGSKGANASARSDGIGLGTVAAAAKAAGGRANLRSYVDGNHQAHVVYCILIPIVCSTRGTHDGDDENSGSLSSSTTSMSDKQAASFSSRSASMSPATIPSKRRAPQHLGTGLTFVGCDDSPLMRPLIRSAFESLGASTSIVLGASAEEISIVVDVALGLANADGTRREPPALQADIVLLDVNIDVDDKPFAKGTQLGTELRRRGFKGFIALYTAGTISDIRELLKDKHANCVIMKSLQGPKLHEIVHSEYEHFINNRDSGPVVIEGPEPTIGECSTATGAKDGDHVDLPPVRSRLLEIEHMEDVPEAVILALLEDFFSESSAAGMARSLDKLEESISSGLHGEQLHDLVHRMIGDCKCAGAVAVAAQLEEFERSPTVGAVTDMRITIGRTKQEAQKRYPELRC